MVAARGGLEQFGTHHQKGSPAGGALQDGSELATDAAAVCGASWL
ncbi:hypothetical protein [Streptomyces sp. NPDC001135]